MIFKISKFNRMRFLNIGKKAFSVVSEDPDLIQTVINGSETVKSPASEAVKAKVSVILLDEDN
jgi:hypothetical protein